MSTSSVSGRQCPYLNRMMFSMSRNRRNARLKTCPRRLFGRGANCPPMRARRFDRLVSIPSVIRAPPPDKCVANRARAHFFAWGSLAAPRLPLFLAFLFSALLARRLLDHFSECSVPAQRRVFFHISSDPPLQIRPPL